jgi:hypothetical protein
MSNNSILVLFGICLTGMIITSILFIAFGEITVRKLKKNYQINQDLGFEFISGSNIIGIAQALSLPRWIVRRSGTVFGILPDPDMLYEHTTKLDRVLGRIFYWTLMVSVLCGLVCSFLWWATS